MKAVWEKTPTKIISIISLCWSLIYDQATYTNSDIQPAAYKLQTFFSDQLLSRSVTLLLTHTRYVNYTFTHYKLRR